MDLFWTIVILLAVYYAFRFFTRIAVPHIIKRTVRKTEERLRREMAESEEGEEIDIDGQTKVHIRKKKGNTDDDESFTDFEEVE